MRRVYLSHSFADRDRGLVSDVEVLIKSHGLVPVNSRTVGGGALTPEIAKDIAAADALIALQTLRPQDPGNVTHPWVLQEYGHARMSNVPAVALYEKGVPVQGAGTGYEYVDWDPAAPLGAFLKLSAIIGDWKRRAGRLIKVQLMPEDVARRIGQHVSQIRCEYRHQSDGIDTNWQEARVHREVGGVFGYLRVPDGAEMIQIRANGPAISFESAYTPLAMSVNLDSVP